MQTVKWHLTILLVHICLQLNQEMVPRLTSWSSVLTHQSRGRSWPLISPYQYVRVLAQVCKKEWVHSDSCTCNHECEGELLKLINPFVFNWTFWSHFSWTGYKWDDFAWSQLQWYSRVQGCCWLVWCGGRLCTMPYKARNILQIYSCRRNVNFTQCELFSSSSDTTIYLHAYYCTLVSLLLVVNIREARQGNERRDVHIYTLCMCM